MFFFFLGVNLVSLDYFLSFVVLTPTVSSCSNPVSPGFNLIQHIILIYSIKNPKN